MSRPDNKQVPPKAACDRQSIYKTVKKRSLSEADSEEFRFFFLPAYISVKTGETILAKKDNCGVAKASLLIV